MSAEATHDSSDEPFSETHTSQTLEDGGYEWEQPSRHIRISDTGNFSMSWVIGVMHNAGYETVGANWEEKTLHFQRK